MKMKLKNHHKSIIILFFLLGVIIGNTDAQDSTSSPTILSVQYFLPENNLPHISVSTKRKVGKKFEPVTGIRVKVYFNEAIDNNLLGETTTGVSGEGWVAFPASFKSTWDSLNEFKFVATTLPAKNQEALTEEVSVKKAILVIDTTITDGVKTMTAQLKEKKGNEWVPVNQIEMKLGVKRELGNLPIGESDTYTSDSTGIASVGFNRDSLPGDKKGNIVLVAKVEDNDIYGNLIAEKSVPWGKIAGTEANFWHRSLWSTGNRAPVWLLILAAGIIFGVWGTLIYLVFKLIKIRKLGISHPVG